ncbi:B12-binding domain-containing radical SAM protein, partial [Acidobacteriota bacterium]
PGRGCPFHCTFCRAGSVWGHKIRLRSTTSIADELGYIYNSYRIRNIAFMTDLFTINKEWVTELCECLIEKNLGIKWICNSRVDGVSPELTKIMSKAGCQLISYGIESGDEEILKKSKKQISLNQAEEAIRWTREAGILSFGYFIIGLPGETWKTVDLTIKTALRINPDYALFHLATPFPGTELYTWAKENNYLVSDNWTDYDEENGRAMRTEAMSLEELQKAKRLATRKFYMRPSKIVQSILQVKSPSDLFSKSKAALKILRKTYRTT